MIFTIHQHELAFRYTCVSPPPHTEDPSHLRPHSIPLGCSRAAALGALLHAANLRCSSILRMVIYMFQFYSLKSSHPHLLPLSPKVCSFGQTCLCLVCCPVPWHSRVVLVAKNPPANAGDMGLIPGLGRSPGGGNSNPL